MRIFVGSTGLPMPGRPKPLYSFFPIYSPFKVNDDDGFNMGEDNRIKSIEIIDGALQFEVRSHCSMMFASCELLRFSSSA